LLDQKQFRRSQTEMQMADDLSRRRLEGRVAIVTGAGQGIGKGIALALAKEGARLLINGRTLEKLDAVAAEIRETGGTVICLEGVVGDPNLARRAVEQAVSAFGRIDILVNNAHSFTAPTSVELVAEDDLRINLESGLIGSLQLMQAAFPHMIAQGGGSIINMGSHYSHFCMPGCVAYAASKEAIAVLTKTAAREWGRHQIRVNILLPAALSPAALDFLKETGAYEPELAATALGYIGDAERDVAPVAVFLASDDSHYMTGQTICADGGRLMH
jgi:NAD(P)-dependent dehydrogenase (short-subunit alcohol dehydrogenase family)